MNFEESIKKFRAFDAINKKFAFVGFDILGEVTLLGALDIYKHENSLSLDETLELKITQDTGAKDIQGTDIYEGDILQAPSGLYFLVAEHKEEMRWALLHKDTWYNMNSGLYRVIGNIYENANLLN